MDGYDQDYQNQEQQEFQNQQDDQSAVKQQIARFPAHESFDVSSFAQSKNGIDVLPKHKKGGFPYSNAPTLQVSPEPKTNFLHYNKNSKPQQFKNQTGLSLSKSSNAQQDIILLKKQMQLRQDEYIQKIQELNNTNLELEKVIREKDAIIRQKEELLLLQQKKYKALLQSSSKNVSFPSQQKSQPEPTTSYIDEFCPQLLSPQQSLQLFTQLMSKIDKSSSMKKKILKDRKILGMLSQLIRQ